MIQRLANLILLTFATAFLISCNVDYDAMGENRLDYARKQKGPIIVAVIVNRDDPSYHRGVKLAVKEINKRPNQLLGRPVEIHTEFEADTVEESMPSIQRISNNPKIVAVLGHRQSSIAIPASALYERSQIVFLSSFATADTLTGHKFNYVFRMMPNTKILATQQANIAKSLGYTKIVTLHSRSAVSRELAFLFEDAVIEEGIKIIKRASFFGDKDRNYRSIISQFNSEDFDAIYISADAEAAGQMVRQIREMGLKQPIIGSDALSQQAYDTTAQIISGEHASNRTIVPSIYKSNIDSPISKHFTKAYQEEYNETTNQRAAQGYDSMHLLARGIEQAKSTLGPTLSSTLHYMPAWVGVTGIHAFDEDGELHGKKYFFQTWQNGQLVDLPAIHHFYLLDRFVKAVKAEYGPNYPVTDFSTVFKQRMHEDEHKAYLLDLAHEIIGFNTIGIIYENTNTGKAEAQYGILKKFVERKNREYKKYYAAQEKYAAKQYHRYKKYSPDVTTASSDDKPQSVEEDDKKFITISECQIPFSLLNEEEAEKHLLSCYGRLSLQIDAMLTPSYYRNPNKPDLIQRLDAALGSYKIPSISIDPRGDINDASITLTKRTDIKLHSTKESHGMQVYNGLLKDLKIHEFHDELTGLPEITANLTDLQQDELPDKPLINISTDAYLHSNTVIQRAQ